MKIFISEEDRQNARRTALRNIARFFKIPNWDAKNNDQLLKDLSDREDATSTSIFRLLEEYFQAYDNWYDFYRKRKEKEKRANQEYVLDREEHKQLAELIRSREESLNALQQKFDELQIREFNQKTFGNELSGIIINEK